MCSAHISLEGDAPPGDAAGDEAIGFTDGIMTTRLENQLGALGIALGDSMDSAFDEACAVGDSAPAAMILIHENPDTRIEALARYLELSHSGTVRLVDRLVEARWVAREACEDKRAVVLVLTKAGAKVAERLLEGRRKSIARALQGVSQADRKVLERLVPQMLGNLIADRAGADHVCRYCDTGACDREGCPLDFPE
jgi:MarR family transcriptional regulator, negative regulator of the multidrug operon emrRAB